MNSISALRVEDRIYDIVYTDANGNPQKPKRGKLLSTDKDGFVVIENDGKYILIPKDRVEQMCEVEAEC